MAAVRLAAVAALAVALIWLARAIGTGLHEKTSMAESAMTLGLLILLAYFAGEAAPAFGAPRITGYLFAGIAAGPYLLALVTRENAEPLRLVNGLALSLIAFTAGGEMKLERYRPKIRTLVWAAMGQAVGVGALVFAVILPMLLFTGALEKVSGGHPLTSALAAALLLAALSMANSPATAVAVISEGRAKGPISEAVMGITVLMDMVVIVIFALMAPVAGYLLGMSAEQSALAGLAGHIGGAVAIGLAAGLALIGVLRTGDQNNPLWVCAMALAISEVSTAFHASGLLAAVIAGFVVENYSRHGEELVKGIERSSAPVYMIFFSLAGQGLNLAAIASYFPLTIALVASRMAGIWLGARYGFRRAGDEGNASKYAWTGFLGQAGINIGFALMVAQQYGGVGEVVGAVAISAVAVNQVAGPIMMRRSLVAAGEIAQPKTMESKTE